MDSDELSDSVEFIKMETEEVSEPLLNQHEIASRISSGEFYLRDYNKKGKVWLVFAKIYNLNDEQIPGYVCCKDCGRILTFNTSTSNLVKHRCYILKFILNKKEKQEDLTTSFESKVYEANKCYKGDIQKQEFSNSSFEHRLNDNGDNNLEKLFTKCLIKNCRSYEMLQDEDFKAIFQELIAFGAKFGTNIEIERVIPSPGAVAKNLYEIYENCFEKVKIEIAAIKEKGFGLACHVWTNDIIKENYFVLTIHFLSNGKVSNRLLGLKSMEAEKYSNQYISDEINNILKTYDCELSSTSLITTSGSINILKDQFLPCISSLLNDALTKSMNKITEISEAITDCMKLRNFLNRNEIKILPENIINPKCWLSLYKEIELFATSWPKNDITNKIESESQTVIDTSYLEAVVEHLRPFKDALESLKENENSTLHLVIVYLHGLKKSCEMNKKISETSPDKTNILKNYDCIEHLKQLFKQDLENIIKENVTIFHKVALFLYPPASKLMHFDEAEKKNVEAECIRLMKRFKIDLKSSSKKESNENYTPQSKRKRLFSDFVNSETKNDPDKLIEEELQMYKLIRVLDSDDFDVFNWWEQQQQNFPYLYKLSHMVLLTPASSLVAQNIFASVGDLLSHQMSELCLTEKDKEQIAFLKFNAEHVQLDF